ncbi:MAG: HEAT repeat domain-containing protein, partial [Acidobacteriota bacterium]
MALAKIATQLLSHAAVRLLESAAPKNVAPEDSWLPELSDLGLAETESGLSGVVGAHRLEISKGDPVQIEIHPVDPGFTVVEQTPGLPFGNAEWPLGEPAFDLSVRVAGDAGYALLLLDVEVRTAVQQLIGQHRGSVTAGRLVARVDDQDDLVDVIEEALELAERFEDWGASSLADRLERVAADSDLPGFRRDALDALLREFRNIHGFVPDFSPLTLTPPPLALRLKAATLLLHLGDAGRDAGAQVMLRILRAHGLGDEVRWSALELLVNETDRDAARPILEAWLAEPVPSERLRIAAIKACGRRGVYGPLLHLDVEDDEEQLLLINTLSELEDPVVQPRMIEALQHPSVPVQVAAARALAQVGDLDAIPALVAAQAKARRWRSSR